MTSSRRLSLHFMYDRSRVDLQLLDLRQKGQISQYQYYCADQLFIWVWSVGTLCENYNVQEMVSTRHSLAETFREVTVLSSSFSAMQVKVTFSSGAITILLENLPLTYLVSSVWKGKKWILVFLKNARNTFITCITHWKCSEVNNFQL